MPLTAQDLERAAGIAAAAAGAREAAAALRSAFPGMPVTRVDALDMRGELPVTKLPLCDLFLVDARNHCWTVTTDPASATGFAVSDKS